MKKILIVLAMAMASANCLAETYNCIVDGIKNEKWKDVYPSGKIEANKNTDEFFGQSVNVVFSYNEVFSINEFQITTPYFSVSGYGKKGGATRLDRYSVMDAVSLPGEIRAPFRTFSMTGSKINLHIRVKSFVKYSQYNETHYVDYKMTGRCAPH